MKLLALLVLDLELQISRTINFKFENCKLMKGHDNIVFQWVYFVFKLYKSNVNLSRWKKYKHN